MFNNEMSIEMSGYSRTDETEMFISDAQWLQEEQTQNVSSLNLRRLCLNMENNEKL